MGQYDVYAMPNVSAEGGLWELFGYVNTVNDGIFFPAFFGAFWLIAFIIGTRIATPAKALAFSSFLGMVLSMPLTVLGFLSPKIMYALIIAFAIGIFWTKQENSL
jgi:hypothetical protein